MTGHDPYRTAQVTPFVEQDAPPTYPYVKAMAEAIGVLSPLDAAQTVLALRGLAARYGYRLVPYDK